MLKTIKKLDIKFAALAAAGLSSARPRHEPEWRRQTNAGISRRPLADAAAERAAVAAAARLQLVLRSDDHLAIDLGHGELLVALVVRVPVLGLRGRLEVLIPQSGRGQWQDDHLAID